jgi:hypothetical protein
MAPTPSGGCNEIHISEGANEGEQDAEADGKARAQGWVLEMHDPGLEVRAHGGGHALHAGRLLHGEIDQHCADQVERGEEVEIGGKTEMVCYRGGDQTPNQIARDISGDIGGEGARRVGGAVVLTEISEREGKGRRHAQPLRHAQNGEHREVGSAREQSRWDG